MKHLNIFPYVTFALLLAELMLIIVSWIVAAVWPELPVQTILSAEGARWLVGSFADNMASVPLVWLLLAAMSVGAFKRSGLISACSGRTNMRSRNALKLVIVEVFVYIGAVAMLSAVPDAVFLNVSGNLFPGALSKGLVPLAALLLCVCSVTYGLSVGRLRTLSDVFDALVCGISDWASLFVVYTVVTCFYFSLCFVFTDKTALVQF